MAGIVTRIGQWIDERWKEKATLEQHIEDRERLIQLVNRTDTEMKNITLNLQVAIENLAKTLPENNVTDKEFDDLKTRIERIEVYAGMTRKVDPTKPPVAKSAFSM